MIGNACDDGNSNTINDHCGGGANDPANTLGVCIGETPPPTGITAQQLCAANLIATANNFDIQISQQEADQIAAAVFADPKGVDLSKCSMPVRAESGSSSGTKCSLTEGPSRPDALAFLLPAFAVLGVAGWRMRRVRVRGK
jgi:hypothetical protein